MYLDLEASPFQSFFDANQVQAFTSTLKGKLLV